MLVEVVTCSVADALAAVESGADRLEVCSSIEVGGLTPTLGLVREILDRITSPVMAMVRPRPGHFSYSRAELAVMRRDADALAEIGVAGIVFGILNSELEVDRRACEPFMSLPCEKTFHRAFDLIPDQEAALEVLCDLGFDRILTSGGKSTALEGADKLARLGEQSNGRIEILAGGGVRNGNVRSLAAASKVDQIHLGPFRRVGLAPGPYGEGYLELDSEELAEVVNAVRT